MSHLVCQIKFWHITKSQIRNANLCYCSVSAEEVICRLLSFHTGFYVCNLYSNQVYSGFRVVSMWMFSFLSFFSLPPRPLDYHLSLSGNNLRERNEFPPVDFRDQLLTCGGGTFPEHLPDTSPARQSPATVKQSMRRL